MLFALRRKGLWLFRAWLGAGATVGLCQSRPFVSFQHQVDSVTGALRFDVITNPRTGLIRPVKNSASSVFERFASKVWVPPSRPDLKKKRAKEVRSEK